MRSRVLSLLVLLLSMPINATLASSVDWHAETIDTTLTNVNGGIDIELDAASMPHIAYYVRRNDGDVLKYAYRDTAGWNVEMISSDADQGLVYRPPGLQFVDGSDPAVIYRTADGAIAIATRSGGVWSEETVSANGWYPRLAVDADGNRHALWGGGYGAYLWYAKNEGAGWSSEPVVVEGYQQCGGEFSLAVGIQGWPHISFTNCDDASVTYVTKSDAGWVAEHVAESGGWTSIALDCGNHPHVTFGSYSYSFHASRTLDTWSVESLGQDTGYWIPLALDTACRVCVGSSYFNVLRYKVKMNGDWHVLESNELDGSFQNLDMCLDQEDLPHYAFQGLGYVLRYASIANPVAGAGEQWSQENVALQALSCTPNPFNPRTTISYTLGRQETVDIRVYDISGRLVKTLVSREEVGAGPHQVTWSGRDEQGLPVASGAYFYRLDTGEVVATRKMMLIR